jgi:hypothetical protein
MKFKLPKIYSYQIMNDEWSKNPTPEVLADSKKASRIIVFEESPSMKRKRKAVVELINKHEQVLRELEDAMLEYHKDFIIEFPQVSPVLVKKSNSRSEGEYYNARVMWPERDGKQRELRVYLGKKSEFEDFTKATEIQRAQQIIAAQLKKRIANNTLEIKGGHS